MKKEQLKGGISDKKTIEQIAKEQNVDISFAKDQLEKGITVEREHTDNDEIAKEIGELHTRLKNVTIDYYIGMKTAADEQQKEKLNEIFRSMLKQNEDVKLPGGYGRNGRGFRNNK